jgi:hypothetical protein
MIDQPPIAIETDMREANALIAETAKMIYQDPAYAHDGWQTAAIVFNFVDGRKNTYGYIFRSDGSWKAELPELKVWMSAVKKMQLLQALMQKQTGKTWHRALLHIDRETTAINITFEYDDPTRWTISPSNLEASVATLRP